MSVSTILAHRTLAIAVDCADAAPLQWLEEFLSPSFAVRASGASDCRVALVADDDEYRRTVQRGARQDGERAACFALDTGLIRLPWWTPWGQERVIYDGDAKAFYCLHGDGSRVRILVDRLRPSRRIGLMRVVREFAVSHAWSETSIVLHAAAMTLGETGVVIAGPKGAGKTTLLMQLLLQAPDATFVSNDRVVLDLDGTTFLAHGLPTVVQIQAPTLALLPELRMRLQPRTWDHRLAQGETYSETPAPKGADQPVQLTPAQCCALLETPIRAHAAPRVLLFPRVFESHEGADLEALPCAQAAERLRSLLIGGAHPALSEVFALPSKAPGIDERNLDRLCVQLASRMRCFDCRLGRQAYRPASVAKMIDSIRASSPMPAASRSRADARRS